jgi:hypothetical protein
MRKQEIDANGFDGDDKYGHELGKKLTDSSTAHQGDFSLLWGSSRHGGRRDDETEMEDGDGGRRLRTE